MLFRKKIDKACHYCVNAARYEEGLILCTKKGVMAEDAKCRKFKYDPCKRIPPKPKALNFSRYDEDDFSL